MLLIIIPAAGTPPPPQAQARRPGSWSPLPLLRQLRRRCQWRSPRQPRLQVLAAVAQHSAAAAAAAASALPTSQQPQRRQWQHLLPPDGTVGTIAPAGVGEAPLSSTGAAGAGGERCLSGAGRMVAGELRRAAAVGQKSSSTMRAAAAHVEGLMAVTRHARLLALVLSRRGRRQRQAEAPEEVIEKKSPAAAAVQGPGSGVAAGTGTERISPPVNTTLQGGLGGPSRPSSTQGLGKTSWKR